LGAFEIIIIFCRHEVEEALDIKPPQVKLPKKDKHKHKRDKKRSAEKERRRDKHGERERCTYITKKLSQLSIYQTWYIAKQIAMCCRCSSHLHFQTLSNKSNVL
jgi:hypothetical protein